MVYFSPIWFELHHQLMLTKCPYFLHTEIFVHASQQIEKLWAISHNMSAIELHFATAVPLKVRLIRNQIFKIQSANPN